MMCVTTKGLIVGAYGPYEARENDATILNNILQNRNNDNLFQQLRQGDFMIVDRGFRDSIHEIRRQGFEVKIPALNKKNTCTQLTRSQTNESRLVTKIRWMVEARNGHIKRKFRYLDGVKTVQSIPYAQKDFKIAVALINATSHDLESDKNNRQVAQQMLALRDVPNHLGKIVRRILRRSFGPVTNLSLYPKLTFDELRMFALGSYQIKQAQSYCQLHLNESRDFLVYVCDEEECEQKCAQFSTDKTKLVLILVLFKSRFQTLRTHSHGRSQGGGQGP